MIDEKDRESFRDTRYYLLLLNLVFIGLKLSDHIDWSWIWIFAPLWIPFALWLLFALLAAGTGALYNKLNKDE